MTFIVVYAKEDQDANDLIFTVYRSRDEMQEGDIELGEAEDDVGVKAIIQEYMTILLLGDEDGAGSDSNWH